MEEEFNLAIIELGSYMIRAGLSENDIPSICFRSVIGKSLKTIKEEDRKEENNEEEEKENIGYIIDDIYYVEPFINFGNDNYKLLLDYKGNSFQYRYGVWDDREKLIFRIFYEELFVVPEETPVYLIYKDRNVVDHVEKMIQIMFETFNIPAVYIFPSSLLALNATGRKTGIVIDSGYYETYITVIIDSIPINSKQIKLKYGGKHLTNSIKQFLREKSYPVPQNPSILSKIKEKLCYISLNYEEEIKQDPSSLEKSFLLPSPMINYNNDNSQPVSEILLDTARIRCTEALFQPQLLNKTDPGIHHALYTLISQYDDDPDMKSTLLNNIILHGGNTMFKNFPERLFKEMSGLISNNNINNNNNDNNNNSYQINDYNINIISPPDRTFSSFIAASLLGKNEEFLGSNIISKEEYDEGFNPAQGIHRRTIF